MTRSTANVLPPAVVEWVLTRLPIRKEQGAAWQGVEAAGLGDRIRVGLRMAAAGVGIRDAATAAGYASHAELSRKFREFGFCPLDRSGIAHASAQVAGLGYEEMTRRLETNPDKISDSMLNAITGTAVDKKAAAEGWTTKDAARNTRDTLQQFFQQLEARGTPRVSLDVAAEPDVQVTPKPNGSRKKGDA